MAARQQTTNVQFLTSGIGFMHIIYIYNHIFLVCFKVSCRSIYLHICFPKGWGPHPPTDAAAEHRSCSPRRWRSEIKILGLFGSRPPWRPPWKKLLGWKTPTAHVPQKWRRWISYSLHFFLEIWYHDCRNSNHLNLVFIQYLWKYSICCSGG